MARISVRKVLIFTLLLILALCVQGNMFSFAAETDETDPTTVAKEPWEIETENLTVNLKEKEPLYVEAKTTEDGSVLSYESSDESIATVNEKTGKLTLKKAGTVTIHVTAAENEMHTEATADAKVTVYKLDAPKIYKINNAIKGVRITWSEVSDAKGYIVYRRVCLTEAEKAKAAEEVAAAEESSSTEATTESDQTGESDVENASSASATTATTSAKTDASSVTTEASTEATEETIEAAPTEELQEAEVPAAEEIKEEVAAEETETVETPVEEQITEETVVEATATEEAITEQVAEAVTTEPEAEGVATEPATEEAAQEETLVENQPEAEVPVIEETVTQPVVEEPVITEPAKEEVPVAEQAKAEEPVVEEKTIEEPAKAETPVKEPPEAKEPVKKQPKAEETVAEEQADEEVTDDSELEEIPDYETPLGIPTEESTPQLTPEMAVYIFAALNGDMIDLTSQIEGFEGYKIGYQWECDKMDGVGFQNVEGATESTYSFLMTAENIQWEWRLTVYLL